MGEDVGGTVRSIGRRLYWAWRFKVPPWKVPTEVVTYLSCRVKITPAIQRRGEELAARLGRGIEP